jgi:hypothetical protein
MGTFSDRLTHNLTTPAQTMLKKTLALVSNASFAMSPLGMRHPEPDSRIPNLVAISRCKLYLDLLLRKKERNTRDRLTSTLTLRQALQKKKTDRDDQSKEGEGSVPFAAFSTHHFPGHFFRFEGSSPILQRKFPFISHYIYSSLFGAAPTF